MIACFEGNGSMTMPKTSTKIIVGRNVQNLADLHQHIYVNWWTFWHFSTRYWNHSGMTVDCW